MHPLIPTKQKRIQYSALNQIIELLLKHHINISFTHVYTCFSVITEANEKIKHNISPFDLAYHYYKMQQKFFSLLKFMVHAGFCNLQSAILPLTTLTQALKDAFHEHLGLIFSSLQISKWTMKVMCLHSARSTAQCFPNKVIIYSLDLNPV